MGSARAPLSIAPGPGGPTNGGSVAQSLASQLHRLANVKSSSALHRSPDTHSMDASRSIIVGGLLSLLASACATTAPNAGPTEPAGAAGTLTDRDLATGESGLIDCLLPAQTRKVGPRFIYL